MEFNEKKKIDSIINNLEIIIELATYCLEDITEEYYPNSTQQDKFDVLSTIKYRCTDINNKIGTINYNIDRLYKGLDIK